jgi:hypothetical protein
VQVSLLESGYFTDNVVTHLVAGLGAGFFAVCVGSPVDVVKSRVMGEWAAAAAAAMGHAWHSNVICIWWQLGAGYIHACRLHLPLTSSSSGVMAHFRAAEILLSAWLCCAWAGTVFLWSQSVCCCSFVLWCGVLCR